MCRKIVATAASAFFVMNAFAGEMGVYDPDLPLEWASIITLSGGPAWANPGKDQYLYPYPPPLNNYFKANKNWTTLGTGEIYFGLQRFICSDVIGQFGIGAALASDAKLSGEISINGVPDVIGYNYKVMHGRAEFKGKLIAAAYNWAQPYLSASLGVGFNHTHDYFPVTTNGVLYPPSYFNANSNVSFSYTAGAGLQRMLTQHWQVGVGYEFADWGKNYLGSDDNLLGQGPDSPHLYTHELLFSFSYLF
jgi:hypothetical protein